MEPASIRYKNPGAMWGSALAIKWGAEKRAVTLNDGKGQGNNIAVFPTYVDGICAQLDLWRSSPRYKNKPFWQAITVWSGGNEVESYIAFVLKRVPGMTRDTVMNDAFWRSANGIAFLKAQAWHEAGKKYPAPDEDWVEAQRRVFASTGPSIKTKPVATPTEKTTVLSARTIGGGIGTAAVAIQTTKAVIGDAGETVQTVRDITDNGGQVVATVKEVVKLAPQSATESAWAFMQRPSVLAIMLAVVLASWALSWYIRRRKSV